MIRKDPPESACICGSTSPIVYRTGGSPFYKLLAGLLVVVPSSQNMNFYPAGSTFYKLPAALVYSIPFLQKQQAALE